MIQVVLALVRLRVSVLSILGVSDHLSALRGARAGGYGRFILRIEEVGHVLVFDLHQSVDVVFIDFDFLHFGLDFLSVLLILLSTAVLLALGHRLLDRDQDADLAFQDDKELVTQVAIIKNH